MGEWRAADVAARPAPSARVAVAGHPEVIILDLRGVDASERSEVLGMVATRVRQRLREGDVVAPLGADQLGVVVRGVPGPTIESLKRRIAEVFDDPVVTATGQVRRLEGSVRSVTADASPRSGDGVSPPVRTAAPMSDRIPPPPPSEAPAREAAARSRDALTSLLLPRALAAEVAALPTAYALALLDVDGVAAINACLGLAGGDAVLAELARLLTDAHDRDLVCRWAGQQFVVVMPTVSAEGAAPRIERLLARTMAQVRVSVRRVSFCAGIASGVPGDDLDIVVREAARSLRVAKARGRGTVVVDEPQPPRH